MSFNNCTRSMLFDNNRKNTEKENRKYIKKEIKEESAFDKALNGSKIFLKTQEFIKDEEKEHSIKAYKAIYKCRLCGELFCCTTTKKREVATQFIMNMCFNETKKPHYCSNTETGDIGIADFQGWKEMEIEE